ncbi:hypothetical protein GF337_18260 [candidate division KSB1 bacterium]|nr:hypothetical protein [candidate division KSB1 bacterium]
MRIPFTIEQFLSVFEKYNLAVFPMQILLYLLAIAAIILTFWRTRRSDRIINSILAFFWFWMGIVYHLIHFTVINKAAILFGIISIIQGMIFLYAGALNAKLTYGFKKNGYFITGAIFILYALLIYPLLSYVFGHAYPSNPTFGLPCPTTIFTFGLFLWTARSFPKYILLIPFLWAIIGSNAAFSLGVKEDYGLLVAAVLGTILIYIRDRKRNNGEEVASKL